VMGTMAEEQTEIRDASGQDRADVEEDNL